MSSVKPTLIQFQQVNPDKALEMCLNQDDACAATRFYLHQCRQQGVHLSPPKECGKYPNFYYRSITYWRFNITQCKFQITF